MEKNKLLVDLINQIRKLHLSIIIICGISIAISMEFLIPSPLTQELKTFQKLFEGGISKSFLNYNNSYTVLLLENLEKQFLVHLEDKYINWDKEKTTSLVLFDIDSDSLSMLNDYPLDYLKNIVTTQNITIKIPNEIDTCFTIDKFKGIKEEFDYFRTHVTKVVKFKVEEKENEFLLHLFLLDRFMNVNAGGGGNEFKGRRDIRRELICKGKSFHDTLPLIPEDKFQFFFPLISKEFDNIKNHNLTNSISYSINLNRNEILNRAINILGIKIQVRHIGITIFILLSGLLIYILGLLQALKDYIIKIDGPIKGDAYLLYWIGFINNFPSKVLTYTTLILCPILSLGLSTFVYTENVYFFSISVVLGIILVFKILSHIQKIVRN